MAPLKLLVIPGSARTGSLNRKLAAFAAQRAEAQGAQVEQLDLRSLDLPVYDGDLEAAAGIPAGAVRLQAAIAGCSGLLVVTPEYNGFPTPLVINAFDWVSRVAATDTTPAALATTANKPVALMAASPGAGGALRSMNFLRQYLQMAFAMIVVPQQFALGAAHEAFDDSGGLKDTRSVRSVDTVIRSLTRLTAALQTAG